MPCYNPLQAFFVPTDTGKRQVAFSDVSAKAFHEGSSVGSEIFGLPCGKCMGCKLERSRQWAVRMMHEASCYDDNCFINLTYSPENLPVDGSLDKRHFQLFMKRLRGRLSSPVRFYHCGEYGEQNGRPHYHAILFNFDPKDKVFYKMSDSGEKLYNSAFLDDLWGFGHVVVGSVTFDSAAYCARYCTKVISGPLAHEHYQGRSPEYSTMSRNPGIGRPWYDKWCSDVFPSDDVILEGVPMKPPRYYDNIYMKSDPDGFERVRQARVSNALNHSDDNSYRRLKDREHCQLARFNQLKRPLEV